MSSRVHPGTPPFEDFPEEEFPWASASKEKEFLSDWALVEDWVQGITTNMKANNENIKTEVKKVMLLSGSRQDP